MIHRPAPRLSALLMATLLAGLAPAVQAQSAAPWFVRATVAMLHDTNYLRLADGQPTPAGYVKADNVVTGTLAAGFDRRFGADQRAYAEAQVRTSRLANNSLFDNQGWRAEAGLDWRAGNILAGEMRVLTDRSLATLESGTTGVPSSANLITLSQADAAVRFGRSTGFNAEAALGWREVDYSSALYDNRDYHEGSAFAGVRYRPSERSSFGLGVRATRGSYPRYQATSGGGFLADDYDGRFVDLTATYTLTGKSVLRARLSSGRIRHETALQSDYSGLTGSLDWNWTPTGKLRLFTRVTREPSQDAYFVTDPTGGTRALEFSRISTSMRLQAEYAASERFRVRAYANATHRELSQSVPLAGGATVLLSGNDRAVSGGLGLTWIPTSMLSLGCDVGHELRRGVAPLSSDITASSLGCQVQLSLGNRPL